MVIRRRARFIPPQSIVGVERVKTMKVHGVVLSEDLSTATHISGVLESCSRSLYALRILRSHGLPESALHEVARATTLVRLLYASPAWWGFASASDKSRVERFLQRTIRMGYLPPALPLSWSQRLRLDYWLRLSCGLITFFDHYSLH